jgi:hypothetical protein
MKTQVTGLDYGCGCTHMHGGVWRRCSSSCAGQAVCIYGTFQSRQAHGRITVRACVCVRAWLRACTRACVCSTVTIEKRIMILGKEIKCVCVPLR